MTTFQSIDDALFTVGGDDIVLRRKSLVLPLILLLGGIALAVWSVTTPALEQNASLSAGLMLVGGIAALAGLIMTAVASGPKGRVAVDRNTGERVRRYELFYEAGDKAKLCNALTMGDIRRIALLPRSESSRILLTLYCTKSGSLMIAQVSEYVPHSFEPVTEVYKYAGEHGVHLAAVVA